MSKSLLGGSAAAVALLSASFLFYARPSVAETLAVSSQEIQQKGDTQAVKTTGADVSPTTVTPAETGEAVNDKEKSSATPSVSIKSEPVGESEASSPTLAFTATAYSLRGRTASGRTVARGLIAADRRLLPIGTRVRLEAGSYSGEYTVADTGGAVRGRKIDIWVPSTGEAMRFGRRPIKLTVLTRTRARSISPRAVK
jgi:3D (Asp-Asp-Asp) domain-containing protein